MFITATEEETYQTWAVRHGVSSSEDDDDGDGFSNILEYALGLDPHFNDSAVTPKPIAASESGVEVTMPAIAAGDLAVFVEASDDLGAWTNLATRIGNGSWSPAAGVVITSEALPESRVRWTFEPTSMGDAYFTRFGASLMP